MVEPLKEPAMTRIALFGTSADPPTAGHQSILHWLAEHYDRVAVWASDNPFKPGQTPLAHRMAMLQLLIQDMDSTLSLEPDLSDRYSLNSLQRARSRWGKEADYTLVIGSDLVEQIAHWYRVADIFSLARLLIIPRPHYPINPDALTQLEQMGAAWEIANWKAPAVSSTNYRQTHDEEVIPLPVQQYIQQEQLYL
jgi:nicotinate-nucleotide adenylyltransferase